ncbi:hypothetical protein [Marinobacterium rhizophilum]|uniref:hypothetical protein n=1 Tax=Marinobacterium rhizophilum TaxID=420402 RepID=UPI000370532D|nr:hypothetical protein [Marinobacterium rhizophilum]
MAGEIGLGPMEDVMRRAIKLVRLRKEIIDLSFLDDDSLANEVKSAFSLSAERHTNIDEYFCSKGAIQSAKTPAAG